MNAFDKYDDFMRYAGLSICANPVSVVGRLSSQGFGRLQVQFPGPAKSFTSCQLLVKGLALSTGYLLSVVRIG